MKRKNSYNRTKYERALDRSKKVVLLSIEILSFVIKHRKQSIQDIFITDIEIKNPRMETNLISWLYDLATFPSGSVREALFEIFKYFVHYIEEKDCVARFIKDSLLPRALSTLAENEFKLDYYDSNGFEIFRSRVRTPKKHKRTANATDQPSAIVGDKRTHDQSGLVNNTDGSGTHPTDPAISRQKIDVVRESMSKMKNRYREKLRKLRYTQYSEPEEERRLAFEDKADDSENSAKQSTLHKQVEGSVYSELQQTGELLKKRVCEASVSGSEEEDSAVDLGLMRCEFRRQKNKIYLYVRFVMELVEVSDKLCASTGVESGNKTALLLKLKQAFYKLKEKHIRIAFLRLLLEVLKKGNREEIESLLDQEMILNLLRQAESVFRRNSMISCLLKGIFSEIGRKGMFGLRRQLSKVVTDENEQRKANGLNCLKIWGHVQELMDLGSRRESVSLGSGVDLGLELGADDPYIRAQKGNRLALGLCMGYDDDEDDDDHEDSGLLTTVDKVNQNIMNSQVNVFPSGMQQTHDNQPHNTLTNNHSMEALGRKVGFNPSLQKGPEWTKEEEEQMDQELMELLESNEQKELEKESKRIRDSMNYRSVHRFGETAFGLNGTEDDQSGAKSGTQAISNKEEGTGAKWTHRENDLSQATNQVIQNQLQNHSKIVATGDSKAQVSAQFEIKSKDFQSQVGTLGDMRTGSQDQLMSGRTGNTFRGDGSQADPLPTDETKDELILRNRKKADAPQPNKSESQKVAVQFLKLSHK